MTISFWQTVCIIQAVQYTCHPATDMLVLVLHCFHLLAYLTVSILITEFTSRTGQRTRHEIPTVIIYWASDHENVMADWQAIGRYFNIAIKMGVFDCLSRSPTTINTGPYRYQGCMPRYTVLLTLSNDMNFYIQTGNTEFLQTQLPWGPLTRFGFYIEQHCTSSGWIESNWSIQNPCAYDRLWYYTIVMDSKPTKQINMK
jgi:hypothetical protein